MEHAITHLRCGMAELRRRADDVCRLILRDDYPDVDVAIARQRLREYAEQEFPERMDLYDMIYESRFDRLIGQFRTGDRPWRRGHDGENSD